MKRVGRTGFVLVAAAAAGLSLAALGVALTGSRPTHAPESSTPAPSGISAIAEPTPLPLAEDGVPTEIDGEAVLRGAAVGDHLSCPGSTPDALPRDPAPFLAAGWLTNRGRGGISLVEARTDHPATWFFLMGNGTEGWLEPPAIRWRGGFVVLRVQATCGPWPGRTVLVTAAIRELDPGAPTPSPTAATVDDAGIPLALDGAPVLRGSAIRDRLGGGTEPFVAAGWLLHVNADCMGPSGGIVGCDFTGLIDPARGIGATTGGIRAVDPAGQPFPGAGGAWPGGFVVLRAYPGCASVAKLPQLRCLTVTEVVPPPAGVAPTPTPLPMPTMAPVTWDGEVPERVGEDELWTLDTLAANLDQLRTIPKKVQIVVGGVVTSANDGCTRRSCPRAALATTLSPASKLARASRTSTGKELTVSKPRFQLLKADGSPFRPGSRTSWANGLHVLEVQPWKGKCPWTGSCRSALRVVRAVAEPFRTAAELGGATFEGKTATMIGGEPVLRGADAVARAARPGEFYATGRIGWLDFYCSTSDCPGSVRVLMEGSSGRVWLLAQNDTWQPPGNLPAWPDGGVVLRLRHWSGTCPWTSTFCTSDGAVQVVGVVAP